MPGERHARQPADAKGPPSRGTIPTMVTTATVPAPAKLTREEVKRTSDRVFICVRCRTICAVHHACDRRNRYCSPACATAMRAAAVRSASAWYQSTPVGRARHAARQRAYRERHRARAVTQHTVLAGVVALESATEHLAREQVAQPPPPAPERPGMMLQSLPSRLSPAQRHPSRAACGGACSAGCVETRSAAGAWLGERDDEQAHVRARVLAAARPGGSEAVLNRPQAWNEKPAKVDRRSAFALSVQRRGRHGAHGALPVKSYMRDDGVQRSLLAGHNGDRRATRRLGA